MSFSPVEVLQSFDHQELFRQQLLQLRILCLKAFELSRIGYLHTAVLGTLAIKGLVRDVVLANYSSDLSA
jgi:hypothetical protein